MDKLQRVFAIIKDSGGITGTLYRLYRYDDLKIGTLVGTDDYGE